MTTASTSPEPRHSSFFKSRDFGLPEPTNFDEASGNGPSRSWIPGPWFRYAVEATKRADDLDTEREAWAKLSAASLASWLQEND